MSSFVETTEEEEEEEEKKNNKKMQNSDGQKPKYQIQKRDKNKKDAPCGSGPGLVSS